MNLFDLHIHSKFSFDSNATIEAIVEKLVDKKYFGFSITDHNTVEHLEYIQKLKIKDLLFISGIEYTVEGFDLLCYNIWELPPENSNLMQAVEWIKSRGGIIVLAHPVRYFLEITANLLNAVDGLELINRRYFKLSVEFENIYKINYTDWCRRQNKALFANSDSHNLEELGTVGTYIPVQSSDEFVWAVRNKLCLPIEK